MATSDVSAQGITCAFGETTLGKVTNVQIDENVVVLDDTDISHTRENNQSGIDLVSGSIDCLGYEDHSVVGTVGDLALGGTITKDFGVCLCTGVGVGAAVKGQRTSRYSFVGSVET
jgi:hypothetical protein